MAPISDQFQVLETGLLAPKAWCGPDGAAYLFNPSICRIGDGYALAYRVVTPGTGQRRIATCRLDGDLQPMPETVTPFSDTVTFAATGDYGHRALTWHADPRYVTIGSDIYLTWNDGSARPRNHQFMVKMTQDGLRPEGQVREIVARRPLGQTEKNWIFFEAEGRAWCIYSAFPHDVMQVDLSDEEVVTCSPAHVTVARPDYEMLWGTVRGGAQPIRRGDRFLVVAHSSYQMADDLRHYACTIYEMAAEPPFAMRRCARAPIPLPVETGHPPRLLEKLNGSVGPVVYPSGALPDGDDLIVTYGIDDAMAAIARIPFAAIDALLDPVEEMGGVASSGAQPDPAAAPRFEKTCPDLFWWDAKGRSFDRGYGGRAFETGNFGDIASRDIVERILGAETRRPVEGSPKLLAIGSILHQASDGDVIWGAGAKGTHLLLPEEITSLDVRAVRGPLTLEVLRAHGIALDRVTEVFDPGCLIPQLYASEIAAIDPARNADRGPFRIVPHYRDDIFFRRRYHDRLDAFISVDDTPLGLIEKLIGAEVVYSSSLHGLIFAEALGIPAVFLTPHGGEDVFKYHDYYYGTGRYAVRSYDSLPEAMAATPPPLPRFDPDAYLATFPHDRMADLSRFGVAADSAIRLDGAEPADARGPLDFDPAIWRQGPGGLEGPAREARLRVPVAARWPGGLLSLRIGRGEAGRADALSVDVTAQGVTLAALRWLEGSDADHRVTLHLPAAMAGHAFELSFAAPDAGRGATLLLRGLEAAPLAGATASAFLDGAARQAARGDAIAAVRGAYGETDVEYTLEGEALGRAMTAKARAAEGRYMRLVDGAEILVPRGVLSNASMIFMVGPSSSSESALSRLRLEIDGHAFQVRADQEDEAGPWRLRCPIAQLPRGTAPLARVAIRFASIDDGQEVSAAPIESVLVRKIALRKREGEA